MSDEDEWLPYEEAEGGEDADNDNYEDEAEFFRDRRAASRELDVSTCNTVKPDCNVNISSSAE